MPEVRLRATRLYDDRTRLGAPTLPGNFADWTRDDLWLEARVAWRLDRLVFAPEEPSLARLELEQSRQRARIAEAVVDNLGRWEAALARLQIAEREGASDPDAEVERVRREAELDALTGGWFSRAAWTAAAP